MRSSSNTTWRHRNDPPGAFFAQLSRGHASMGWGEAPLGIGVIALLHHVGAPAAGGADESLVPEPADGLADGDGCQAELLL